MYKRDPFFYIEVAAKIHSTLSFKQISANSMQQPPKKTLNAKRITIVLPEQKLSAKKLFKRERLND